jgi:hypothetical protein
LKPNDVGIFECLQPCCSQSGGDKYCMGFVLFCPVEPAFHQKKESRLNEEAAVLRRGVSCSQSLFYGQTGAFVFVNHCDAAPCG